MSYFIGRPLAFTVSRGVTVFHAYKDEFSDIPLEHWYSTSDSSLPGSDFEFDVRDLRRVVRQRFPLSDLDDKTVIQKAIILQLLRMETVPKLS